VGRSDVGRWSVSGFSFIKHDPATTACHHALHTPSLGFSGHLVVQVLTDKPHQPARHLTPLRLRALPLVADKRDSVRVIIPSLFLSPTDNFEDVGLGDVVCVDDRSRGMDWAFEEVDAEPRPVVFPFHVCLVNLFDLHDATGYAAAQICRSALLLLYWEIWGAGPRGGESALQPEPRQRDLSLSVGGAHSHNIGRARLHDRRKGVVLKLCRQVAHTNRDHHVGNHARHYETTLASSPVRSTPTRGPLHDGAALGQIRSGGRASATTLRVNEYDRQLVIGASSDVHVPIIVNQRETD
jgi:hypothetical protein